MQEVPIYQGIGKHRHGSLVRLGQTLYRVNEQGIGGLRGVDLVVNPDDVSYGCVQCGADFDDGVGCRTHGRPIPLPDPYDWTKTPLTDKDQKDLANYWPVAKVGQKFRDHVIACMRARYHVERFLERIPTHPLNSDSYRNCWSEWTHVYKRKDGGKITDQDVAAMAAWFRGQENTAVKIDDYLLKNHGVCDSSG